MTTIDQVHKLLSNYQFRYSSEDELQQAIGEILTENGITAEREVRLSTNDRIDLLVDGGIGIEVKISGATRAVAKQLDRYANHEAITGLILVTTRARHQPAVAVHPPRQVPVRFLNVGRNSL